MTDQSVSLIFNEKQTEVYIKFADGTESSYINNKIQFAEAIEYYINKKKIDKYVGEKLIYTIGTKPNIKWSKNIEPIYNYFF